MLYTSRQRLLILRLMENSPLKMEVISEIVGVSPHTLYQWKRIFDEEGVEGLIDRPRGGPKGSRLPEETKQAVLMMKEKQPSWGVERISAVLMRDPALKASPSAILNFLKESGYEVADEPTVRHPKAPREFERARPNSLWQTDFFDFTLKRQARMVHLITYLDDHSRFVVGYGLHAYATMELALEVLKNAIASYGAPEQVVSDRGPQYANWQGTSDYTRALRSMGVEHILAPAKKHGSTGKVERLWGTIFREFLYRANFLDLDDARTRIGHFIDHYNFQRPHEHLGEGLVPADRYFFAAAEVKKTLKARVSANALEMALHGKPRRLFYLTGQVNGRSFSIHEEGGRLILVKAGGTREEVDLAGPLPADLPKDVAAELGKQYQEHRAEEAASEVSPVCPYGEPTAGRDVGNEQPPLPGVSALDGIEERLAEAGRQDAAESAGQPAAPATEAAPEAAGTGTEDSEEAKS
ncbi:MAG: DDE-type integrase/transposase/recombinase [Candidatus Deferrimicrobiota bacterium]